MRSLLGIGALSGSPVIGAPQIFIIAGRKSSGGYLFVLVLGTHLVVYRLENISGNCGWFVNGTRLFGSFHWKISRSSGTSEKVPVVQFSGSSQNAGPGPGSGSVSGCLFFSKFFCFNFCRCSPVLLFSNVRHLSFVYGGN